MQYYDKDPLTGSKWNKFQIFLSFASTFILSVFSIYWNYKDVKNEKGLSVLNNWPSLRVPSIAMIFTYLIALSFV